MHTKWARPPQLQASGGRRHPTRIYSVSRIQSWTSEGVPALAKKPSCRRHCLLRPGLQAGQEPTKTHIHQPLLL